MRTLVKVTLVLARHFRRDKKKAQALRWCISRMVVGSVLSESTANTCETADLASLAMGGSSSGAGRGGRGHRPVAPLQRRDERSGASSSAWLDSTHLVEDWVIADGHVVPLVRWPVSCRRAAVGTQGSARKGVGVSEHAEV